MNLRWTFSAALLLLCGGGCRDLDRFDTGPDEAYCGEVIAAPFTRAGFARRLRLELQLELSELHTVPGRISSDDADSGPCQPRALFEQAPLRFPQKLEADALSTLQFGQSREHNFLSWVTSSCRGTYLAVVSLMHDGNVEVRLMKGDVAAEGPQPGSSVEHAPPAATIDAGSDAGLGAAAEPATSDDASQSEAFGVFPLRRYASRCAW